jgi:hypothetical protein
MTKRNERLLQSISCLCALLLPRGLQASDVGNIFAPEKTSTSSVCEGIISIPSFPYRTGGDTASASMALPTLTRSSKLPLHLSCDGMDSTPSYDTDTPGMWYQIEGHNQFILAAIETADDSRQIFALFQGSNCGEELECVLGHEQEYENELTWFGEEGVTYYFKVFANPEENKGLFLLDLDVSAFFQTDIMETLVFQKHYECGLISLRFYFLCKQEYETSRPENDQMEQAYPLGMGDPVAGMSSGAWPHGVVNEQCHLRPHSRGLFYSVQGTGEHLELSLRADVGEGNMEVAILTGDDVGKCVAHSEYMSAVDAKHIVYFPSVKGQMYTIVVSGENVGDAGLFRLTLEVSNTICSFELMQSTMFVLTTSFE